MDAGEARTVGEGLVDHKSAMLAALQMEGVRWEALGVRAMRFAISNGDRFDYDYDYAHEHEHEGETRERRGSVTGATAFCG